MLDSNNMEDLILVVLNVLYYYPKFQVSSIGEGEGEEEEEMMLRYEEEKL